MDASVQVVENLFGTQIWSLLHRETGKVVTSAAGAVSMPHSIAKHIRHVSGLNHISAQYSIKKDQQKLFTTANEIDSSRDRFPIVLQFYLRLCTG